MTNESIYRYIIFHELKNNPVKFHIFLLLAVTSVLMIKCLNDIDSGSA